MANYLTVKTFGGYARGFPATLMRDDQFQQLYNMRFYPEPGSSLTYYNILSTTPAVSSYKATMPASGRGRGLFFFNAQIAQKWVIAFQCTTDYTLGKVYALDIGNNTWYTLKSTIDSYHMFFLENNFRMYCCNADTADGAGGFYKWEHLNSGTSWESSLPSVKDKGGTAVNIVSGTPDATLTWNLTATVTSDKDISSEISTGDWIRRSSTSAYWDEVKSVAVGGLSITLMAASSDTGASASGGAQKAAVFFTQKAWRPKFLTKFKGKLWLAQNDNTPASQSSIMWSTTTDWEDWTSAGSGSLAIGDSSTQITGINSLGDYLFIFKDYEYYVYRWTGDLDEPIVQVNFFKYGCVSARTIINVGDFIIYFTGADLRATNGSSDWSLCEGSGFDFLFKQSGSWANQSSTYFALTSADNSYPTAIYDEIEGMYLLRVAGHSYYYDIKRKIFLGELTGDDAICFEKIYSTSALPVIVKSLGSSAASNQLSQYSRGTLAAQANALQFSKLYDFGDPRTIKKINWVEFEFHPKIGANTTITFTYWDGGETIEASTSSGGSGSQTYSLISSAGDDKVVRARFTVNAALRKFGWILSDSAAGGATDGWGIVSFTICWKPQATT